MGRYNPHAEKTRKFKGGKYSGLYGNETGKCVNRYTFIAVTSFVN